MEVSVLCLVKGRKNALENLIQGLSLNTRFPDELIVVLMNEQERELPKVLFPVKQIILKHQKPLPLAAARNLAAHKANGNLLIFLDADCIPAPNLIEQYCVKNKPGCLLNGDVRYLNEHATTEDFFLSKLDILSEPDPIRAGLKLIPHELFWSLNFACTAADYKKIGGFDEKFIGYGGEDTDFAFTARLLGIEMKKVNALAYHQYHESYLPPLNHLLDIVANARVFRSKWCKWPMEGWLKEFAAMGLVHWDDESLKVLRMPNYEEISDARKINL